MLARSKLQVSNRIEVAQAYRRLRAEATTIDSTKIYQQTVYGSAGIAADDQVCHSDLQEAADGAASGEVTGITQRLGTTPTAKTELPPVDLPRSYYHVLPEAFDGRVGTLLRLGAIGMITVFLTLVILGGLVMYTQLSHMLDS